MTPSTSFDFSRLAEFDFGSEVPITALKVDDNQVMIVVTVEHLAQIVLDPETAERGGEQGDPRMGKYQDIREQVQRLLEGQKKQNAGRFEEYLRKGLDGQFFVIPTIELFTQKELKVIDGPMGASLLALPHGQWFAAIDGETQVVAWLRVLRALHDPGAIKDRKVKLVIHHGRDIEWARQAFHDLNLLGIRPNTAIGISMDQRDYGTRVTRRLMEESALLRGRVEERRRQLRKRDTALVTISGLRQGVVATIFGSTGLEIGARQVPDLPEGDDEEALANKVVGLWVDILNALEDRIVDSSGQRRVESIVTAPVVLAALGVVAHKVIRQEMSSEDFSEALDEIAWEREIVKGDCRIHPWLGVAGKRTERGAFSVGGPKEYGRAVAEAIENAHSKSGKQIRGIGLEAVTLTPEAA